ncbi:MAG: branched-chain amino acid ABC transporter permease [Candidatus Hermodarchaeota archaeon]
MKNLQTRFYDFLQAQNLSKENFYDILKKEKIRIIGIGGLFLFLLCFPFFYYMGQPAIAFQIVLNGAISGAIYSILAIGFSLIYGVAKQLKLSLGGYYVVGAYTMYFLLASLQIAPFFPQDFDGILLLALLLLPAIIIIALLVFMRTIFEKRELLFVLISIVICGVGFIPRGLIGMLYAILTVLTFCVATWYLEVPKRTVVRGTCILGVSLPVLYLIIGFPILHLALMTLTIIFVACIAMISDRYILDRFRESHPNMMIGTFAIALIFQTLVQVVFFPVDGQTLEPFGSEDRALRALVSINQITDIFGAKIPTIKLISLVFCLFAVIILYGFIWFSKMGMALRAVSQDEEAASLVGIDIRKITAIVSAIGMGLIAFAAALTSPFTAKPLWNPYMGWWVLIIALICVVLGGMGSLPGSIIAAMLIAYAEANISMISDMGFFLPLFAGFSGVQFSIAIPFIGVLLFIILRPEGILGTKKELEG